MAASRLDKYEARRIKTELRRVVNTWDPIDVIANPDNPDKPLDEYDCITDRLMSQLVGGRSSAEIGLWLHRYQLDHFGLEPEPNEATEFARRVVECFQERLRDK